VDCGWWQYRLTCSIDGVAASNVGELARTREHSVRWLPPMTLITRTHEHLDVRQRKESLDTDVEGLASALSQTLCTPPTSLVDTANSMLAICGISGEHVRRRQCLDCDQQ
jgi:hypothetical protein